MNELGDRLRKLRITATSSDHTVRLTLGLTGVTAEFKPAAARRHTERSLARELSDAMTRIIDGQEKALRMLAMEIRGGEPPRDLRGTPAAERRERFTALLRDLTVKATSPRGCMSLEWRGEREVDVRVHPGTLRRFGDEQLAAEVTAVIGAAFADRLRAVADAHRAIYANGPQEEVRR